MDNQKPVEKWYCAKCGKLMKMASGIGPFCANKKCDNLDGPAVSEGERKKNGIQTQAH